MFESIPQNVSFPAMETKILEYWQANQIYEKSLAARAGSKPFVFYEGPPTANGMPHPGHCLTRAIKDVFPRYRTMRGYYCERKAGWDTHGLPVEVEVCKELGIHSKEEIENYGVEPFIHKCQASVWRYMQEWERLTQRLGFWVNLEEAYVTYHKSFVESVWWSLKELFDRGLLYQGHKIVWWWAQGGTALSSGEVGQGYRKVADPSVYVRFPLVDEEDTSLLVWTTTPWTLPSNQFAAVHPELTYATVQDEASGEKLIVAEALVEAIAAKAKHDWKVIGTQKGEALLGKRYRPPFDYYYQDLGKTQGTLKTGEKQHIAWRVVAADFVTIDSGTGLVHQAPAFGEVDYEVLAAEQDRFEPGEGPSLICSVGPDGKFTAEAPDYQGRWVKEADKDISRELKERGILFLLDQYLHDYPFCWRAEDDPLIQYPRESWFIRTTKFKDQMLANNQQINWLPEHIRDGRFGNFLESNVDWALSRERYWGTPLPIWVCQETGKGEAVASYAELQGKPGATGFEVWEKAKAENPDLVDDLMIHKPYIDEITYDSPFAAGARMKRVPEVIDCWYDSGAMPFAQWGYPHKGEKNFDAQFPADFISEAIDQTRGWFYSQLAISTLLFGNDEDGKTEPHAYPHPFKNCIVLGLMLGEDGQKMSKSKRNYREPTEIFDRYGADALRWYLYANQPPWTSIRYNEQSIKDSIPEFLLRLWNVYSFFVIYANIDGFEPEKSVPDLAAGLASHFDGAAGARPVAERSELDRWILSELNRMIETVTSRMDAYDNYNACAAINEFVDGLSNWYVRRSRDRFWTKDKQSADKLDAYWTLYECLLTTCQVIAPFVPFLSDTLWQNLAGVFGEKAALSVHLCDFPDVDTKAIDTQLSQRMALLREIASLGRQARMNEKLKVRQPLSKVEVVLADNTHCDWLESHSALLCEELNVKEVAFTQDADEYINYQIQPNFKRLGPRVGKLLPTVKKVLGQTDATSLLNTLQTAGAFTLTIEGESLTFDNEDIQVRLTAKEGWAAAQGKLCVVVLNTELTPELIQEGYIKDLVRLIQDKRKELDLEYTAQIKVGIVTDAAEVSAAVEKFAEYIQSETLASSVDNQAITDIDPITTTIADSEVRIYVKQA
ncbi:isoleucine--tRNA ligase [Blastopirellula marina]|uniref:Isoleucine--tRNA ligase n=1 Tax=Blastopirellula marina TaxID=124 RepID=A0A2S8G299_9BACT|nr:isoleucine--tRNA ligase [Blastopirellula marina]PQO38264.1 isoleucine--tRNA ligase [Blastopirellula marina]PTL44920.1 isoleucine--tRNA ligase [Blastopirellula marina]